MHGRISFPFLLLAIARLGFGGQLNAQELSEHEIQMVRASERQRVAAIELVQDSVIAIYDVGRQGGGSGVIIDPSGIAITNHHVIMGAGVKGLGGLADGKFYEWELIGTDPGGDVAVIHMKGRETFPYSELADSDRVAVGDWALAMGNPFVLTEDQVPTVTLGIVSGVKRYQEGAGQNQLVYGNCIQIDSSINPGNSGGPLFDLEGRIIGINGRGSFLDRGRVNVGLGYAISSNQIKNFFPDLLATKLVEHGTLDANFSDQGGAVVCSTINELAPVAKAGLELGDQLLEFEGWTITSANQFTNLICTLPEDWPARLLIRKSDGTTRQIDVRLLGLPYARPPRPPDVDKQPKPAEKQQHDLQQAMYELLAADPGTIRQIEINQRFARHVLGKMQLSMGEHVGNSQNQSSDLIVIQDNCVKADRIIGTCTTTISRNGAARVDWNPADGAAESWVFDGTRFAVFRQGKWRELTRTEAKQSPMLIQALGNAAMNEKQPFAVFGTVQIDGSDKALGQPSYRMLALDDDEDWFYFWLSMYDSSGNESIKLARTSSDKDCDRKGKGITYDGWAEHHGWRIAADRSIIHGLGETVEIQLKLQAVESKDQLDPDWFNIDSLLEQQ